MKHNIFFSITALALIVFGASCNQTTSNNNLPANRGEANQTAATVSGNSMPMDHASMRHSEMKSDPNAANAPFDLQFIDTMIAHHTGAIEMADLAVTNTENAELKKFVMQIFKDQTREINQMKEWREKWFAGQPSAINMEMPGMRESMQMEMNVLNEARGKEFDAEFVRLMIPHHEGAITMSKEALAKSERPEIKTLANQIIKAQQAEINQMTAWKVQR